MISKKQLYIKLFFSTFFLSAFTFGGGYVIIPLMKNKFVDELKWLEEEELINLTTIAQSSPGAVAVNASILLGYKIAKLPGALIAIFGTVLPPLIILTVISFFYDAFRDNVVVSALLKGMQAGIAAVIINVVIDLSASIFREKNMIPILMIPIAFVAVYFFNVNIIYIIMISGFIGFLRTTADEKKIKRGDQQ